MAEPVRPLRTIVNFKDACMDPLSKIVLLEAMSYALEKAESRLDSLSKIFPGVKDASQPALDELYDIRFAFESIGVCQTPGPVTIGGQPVIPAPVTPAEIATLSKEKQTIVKQMPVALQPAMAAELFKDEPVTIAGQAIEGTRGSTIARKGKKEAPEEKAKRTLPESWGALEYKGKTYTSPGAFLREWHSGHVEQIRGGRNYIEQLDDDGFDVYINGRLVPPNLKKEDLDKLKGKGMTIVRKKNLPETPPVVASESAKADAFKKYELPWFRLIEKGKFAGYIDGQGRTIPPEIWRMFTSSELDKLVPPKAEVEK